LEEFVLNDHGCVYRGNPYNPTGKEWNFGQVRLRDLTILT